MIRHETRRSIPGVVALKTALPLSGRRNHSMGWAWAVPEEDLREGVRTSEPGSTGMGFEDLPVERPWGRPETMGEADRAAAIQVKRISAPVANLTGRRPE